MRLGLHLRTKERITGSTTLRSKLDQKVTIIDSRLQAIEEMHLTIFLLTTTCNSPPKIWIMICGKITALRSSLGVGGIINASEDTLQVHLALRPSPKESTGKI